MKRHAIILVLLTVSTAVVFGRVGGFDFVGLDDAQYVLENPKINAGLMADGVVWVFTHTHQGNWHPLTGISHMLDCELFGVRPMGHHLVNAALHVINTLLLYWAMFQLTRRKWAGAFVAALFALHPLHVESVAWVSERKDLLSGLFGILTLVVYVSYARRGGIGRYVLVLAMLGLGLMSKPMLVTWPFLLLLLDYWPLRRVRGLRPERGSGAIEPGATDMPDAEPRSVGFLILEKLPLIALSVGCSVMAVMTQRDQGAMFTADALAISDRLINAVTSYVRYLRMMVWPTDLAAIYPHPFLLGGDPPSSTTVFHTVVGLVLVTAFCLLEIRRRAYLAVGWFWYLGTLVPVIGIVQVGPQALADRFTYLPLVGIFIMVVWGVMDVIHTFGSRGIWRPVGAIAGVAIVVICCVLSWRQLGHWENSETLFTQCVKVSPTSGLAQNNLGDALRSRGDRHRAAGEIELANAAYDRAIVHFDFARRIVPGRIKYRANLAETLALRVQFDLSIKETLAALKILHAKGVRSDLLYLPALHLNLADVFGRQGQTDQAMKHAEFVLGLDSKHRDALLRLAMLKVDAGEHETAIALLDRLLEAHRDDAEARELRDQVRGQTNSD